MNNIYYIKNSMFDRFIDYVKLTAPDYDIHRVIASVGLTTGELSNNEFFLDYEKVVKLLTLTARELQSPLFSLMYASYASETNSTMIDKILPLLKSLDMTYHFVNEYVKAHTNAILIKQKIVSDRIFLSWSIECKPKEDDLFQANMFLAYRAYSPLHKIISENFSCGDDVVVHFPEKYAYLSEDIHRAFGGQAQQKQFSFVFDSFGYAVSYPLVYNDKPFEAKRKELFEIIEDVMSINIVRSQYELSANVAAVIKARLKKGEACDLLSISNVFYLHPRTLQNKLANENRKFIDILEQVRKKAAMDMLSDDNLPIYMIAMKLGFSDTAIFSRAFKTWFNLSPSQWRKQHPKEV
ncbi:helix-turn-helix transcriptional regulator [Aeromonas enteropelogenes]|uniref:helix-turn-helix transcriptional regulator n=1 Tax=Aeromonas enteropelogenes TaxID=29489 RepID=UPI003BA31C58